MRKTQVTDPAVTASLLAEIDALTRKPILERLFPADQCDWDFLDGYDWKRRDVSPCSCPITSGWDRYGFATPVRECETPVDALFSPGPGTYVEGPLPPGDAEAFEDAQRHHDGWMDYLRVGIPLDPVTVERVTAGLRRVSDAVTQMRVALLTSPAVRRTVDGSGYARGGDEEATR